MSRASVEDLPVCFAFVQTSLPLSSWTRLNKNSFFSLSIIQPDLNVVVADNYNAEEEDDDVLMMKIIH